MGKVNVIVVDATGNKEQKVGLPDDIKCGIIMVKLVEKIKLPSVGPDGNPISYKFVHKVTGRQLLEAQTLGEAGIKDGDVLRLQPEITAGALCSNCGSELLPNSSFCARCGANCETVVSQGFQSDPVVSSDINSYNSKISKKKKCSVFNMIIGILSAVFGLIVLMLPAGGYEYSSTYGGDAYTGIQNASAQAANNIQNLAIITKTGFGFLLIIIGLIMISIFMSKRKSTDK